ncbi:substrate-binding domain-containing protein [Paenibacillus sp. P25]|nr:substrate-binding domain-containing protein [Paenibacillus sp. P25]
MHHPRSHRYPGERAELKKLEAAGHPFCLVNQHFEGERFCEVDADHEAGDYEAVTHLLDQGFRQIAFLNGSPQYSNSGDRLKGYLRGMEQAGVIRADAGGRAEVPPHLYYEGNYSRTSGIRAAAALRPHLDRVDAVFVANDRMATGLMQGLREFGVRPGRDVAVVGYDDSDTARVTDPPLTSVAVPFYEMGKLAAEKPLQRIAASDGEAEEGFQIRLKTELVVRQSSNKMK